MGTAFLDFLPGDIEVANRQAVFQKVIACELGFPGRMNCPTLSGKGFVRMLCVLEVTVRSGPMRQLTVKKTHCDICL